MEDCLVRGDPTDLVSVLHHDGLSGITISRLDQLVTKVTGQGGRHGCRCVNELCCLLFVVSGSAWFWCRQSSGCVEVFGDSVGEPR